MTTTANPVYLTTKQLCEKHTALAEGGVRHWIFNAESNGLSKAIKRVGRKVLIDESKFLAWIEEQDQQSSISNPDINLQIHKNKTPYDGKEKEFINKSSDFFEELKRINSTLSEATKKIKKADRDRKNFMNCFLAELNKVSNAALESPGTPTEIKVRLAALVESFAAAIDGSIDNQFDSED